jgi:uncharacterized protein with GYD domain
MAKYLLKQITTSREFEDYQTVVPTPRGAKAAIKSYWGKNECFLLSFGGTDAFVVMDAPDNVSAAAASAAINASGLVQARIVALLTPEQLDAAVKKTVKYRAPGQ